MFTARNALVEIKKGSRKCGKNYARKTNKCINGGGNNVKKYEKYKKDTKNAKNTKQMRNIKKKLQKKAE